MNWASWLLWGFVATVVLTAIMAGSQGLGMTRMNIPYLLGTIFTPNRDRAKLLGVVMHLINGWLFALIYIAAFHAWGGPTWWLGAVPGLVHAGFVLTVGMSILPACIRAWRTNSTVPPSCASSNRRAFSLSIMESARRSPCSWV